MKTQKDIVVKNINRIGLACAILTGIWWSAGSQCEAQDAPADFSPGLQQVVNLSKAGMSDDFIQTYISNSGRAYTLSVDDIIYLHKQGVSDNVIKDLMQTPSTASANPAPAAAPVAAPPAAPAPPADVNSAPAPGTPAPPPVDASAGAPVATAATAPATPTLAYFQDQLAPYGNWINVAGYGLCWQPTMYFGWRPYYDGGHWVYTDSGWFWQSDYPWGDIVFHYGRWTYTSAGWVWVPGYDYAPAWVVWRQADADGYVGWAPLPPGAVFVEGGWQYHGVRVGLDFDFGLGATYFTFVGYDHFWEHDFRRWAVPSDRLAAIYRRSSFENHYRLDHGVFVNEGLNHDRMVVLTHQDIHAARMQDLRHQEEQRNFSTRSTDMSHYQGNGNRPATWNSGNGGNGGWQQNGGRNGNFNR